MTDDAAKLVAGPVYLRLGNAFLYGTGTEPNAKTALICYQNAERFLFDMVSSLHQKLHQYKHTGILDNSRYDFICVVLLLRNARKCLIIPDNSGFLSESPQ